MAEALLSRVDVSERALIDDHRARLRLPAFDTTAAPRSPEAPTADAAPQPAPPPAQATTPCSAGLASRQLRKRDWLLGAMERQRSLSPAACAIERRSGVTREEFLERYYAPSRPVILTGEMADWPALRRWNPAYLAQRLGSSTVEFQAGRAANDRFEIDKDAHRRQAPFTTFLDLILRPGAGNDTYLTAYNSAPNTQALSVLQDDLGFLDKFLSRDAGAPNGMPWIGPAGTVTSLHHDLTNNLIAQIVGQKRLKILPAGEVAHLYNYKHVFSEIADLDASGLDMSRFPKLDGARVYDVLLKPGEIIFMPLGWWHQVKSLEFSVTLTYTNFIWPNDAFSDYPDD